MPYYPTYYNQQESYFKYKGCYYGVNTIIKIKQEYINTHSSHNNDYSMNADIYAKFLISKGDCIVCVPMNKFKSLSRSVGLFTFNINDIESVIEKIDTARYVIFYPVQKKKDYEVKEMMYAWVIYILCLIATVIFKDFIILWIIETGFFIYIRNNIMKDQYENKNI